jgi:hypothetical protein
MDIGLSLGMKQAGASAGDGDDTPWYLAGGVDPANCVAAYQAKGAADYATSKVNLANPGTHDLIDGTSAPAFDTATGWTFDGATTYLVSDLGSNNIGEGNGSFIARYSGLVVPHAGFSFGTILGVYIDDPSFEGAISLSYGTVSGLGELISSAYWCWDKINPPQNNNAVTDEYSWGTYADAVAGLAGVELFINGITTNKFSDGWKASVIGTPISNIYIGVTNGAGAGLWEYLNGTIQAGAFYDAVISSYQMLEVAAAMQAL